MKAALLCTALLLTACGKPASLDQNTDKVTTETVKLYALECGRIDMLDLSIFASNGAYDGQTNKAVSSCYLIRHPKGDLLWDTGLPDALNALPDGMTNGPFRVSVPNTLAGQLAELGVTNESLDYLSISHSHFDHAGNAGTYNKAIFIVNTTELTHMFRDEARADTQTFPAFSALEASEKITFTDEHDVFGDGSVTIIDTSGHTPGHTVLKVELANSGTILLTGDLYHLNRSRELRTVPVFNTDEAQTLRSMDKFEALAERTNARVIIQHSAEDFEALPKPPKYLD